MGRNLAKQRYLDAVCRQRYAMMRRRYADAKRVNRMYMDGLQEKYAAARQSLAANLKLLKAAIKDFVNKVMVFLKIKDPKAATQGVGIIKSAAKSLAAAIKSNIGSVIAFTATAALVAGANRLGNFTVNQELKMHPNSKSAEMASKMGPVSKTAVGFLAMPAAAGIVAGNAIKKAKGFFRGGKA